MLIPDMQSSAARRVGKSTQFDGRAFYDADGQPTPLLRETELKIAVWT